MESKADLTFILVLRWWVSGCDVLLNLVLCYLVTVTSDFGERSILWRREMFYWVEFMRMDKGLCHLCVCVGGGWGWESTWACNNLASIMGDLVWWFFWNSTLKIFTCPDLHIVSFFFRGCWSWGMVVTIASLYRSIIVFTFWAGVRVG